MSVHDVIVSFSRQHRAYDEYIFLTRTQEVYALEVLVSSNLVVAPAMYM